MNVGEMILKIRKENKMTQEEFAAQFHVTRQTISNWEKEKSYPDLQTLVDMSNRFDISLDRMLKEDIGMVKTIDKTKAMNKVMKTVLIILAMIVLICAAYLTFWGIQTGRTQHRFEAGLEEYGFEKEEGRVYILTHDQISYTAYLRERPGPLAFQYDYQPEYKVLIADYTQDGLQVNMSMRKSDNLKNSDHYTVVTVSEGDDVVNFVLDGEEDYESNTNMPEKSKKIYEQIKEKMYQTEEEMLKIHNALYF